MKTVRPIRYDETDHESPVNFVRNLFYGMWVQNEFRELRLVCGECKAATTLTVRIKTSFVDCPCCSARNVL